MRYQKYCQYPESVNDKPTDLGDGETGYPINHELLKAELNTRPHRVRAKDRRKKHPVTLTYILLPP